MKSFPLPFTFKELVVFPKSITTKYFITDGQLQDSRSTLLLTLLQFG
ncbi:hypothetical protein BVRB_8g200250 [Beta vulgaris subsp. vulgaris]|uniref:Uncharacterized protein n=1 Tax=Beta vulgaris subsp. vulgaris TaxID=3555 RepID=A0A7G2RM32_BETVV|nr:hypothetical protein BVRB_8g200250 [Beta vulgaris subsp. vulgaris]